MPHKRPKPTSSVRLNTLRSPLDSEELALIRLSQSGDANAFSDLIRRYDARIFSLAKQVCATLPAETDDVHQETFVTAYKKIRQFRSESALGTWLYRIASNICLMKKRRARTVPFVPITDADDLDNRKEFSTITSHDPSDDPDVVAGRALLLQTVEAMLNTMPVEQRLVFILRDIEERPAKDVSALLGISIPAVKSRLHRARAALRAGMKSYRGEISTRAPNRRA